MKTKIVKTKNLTWKKIMPFAPNYNNFMVMSYLNKSPSFINASIIIIVKSVGISTFSDVLPRY
jgi:hypothetical protein